MSATVKGCGSHNGPYRIDNVQLEACDRNSGESDSKPNSMQGEKGGRAYFYGCP